MLIAAQHCKSKNTLYVMQHSFHRGLNTKLYRLQPTYRLLRTGMLSFVDDFRLSSSSYQSTEGESYNGKQPKKHKKTQNTHMHTHKIVYK